MIVICTHKSPLILEKCLKSIQQFSKEPHKILVVETSDSKISKDITREYNCIFTNSILKYEIGAFNHAITEYPSEPEYFIFQDSVEILSYDWENMFRIPSNNEKLVALCSYHLAEDPCYGCGKVFFENTFNMPFPTNKSYGVMTNSFYVTQSGKTKLIKSGVNKIVANNKNDTYDSERLIGALAYYSCGITSTSEIVGDWFWDDTHFRENTGFTKYIHKHILKRQ